jgi:DNA polymerase III subunit delta'
MLFKDIIGQAEVKTHLKEMVEHNRLSHALLFLGKEGSGALPLAIAFANYISLGSGRNGFPGAEALTDGAGDPDTVMQAHPSYSKVKAMVHPDIHFSYPVITRKAGQSPISTDYIQEWREFVSKYPYGNAFDWLQFIGAENKQGNITAQECNDIIRKLNLKSFESEYKILVLWMPEYLGNEGNKLLKLIEEPPANTLFILVSENESLVLQTILSRTQLVRVPALENYEISQALTTRAKVSPEQASRVSAVAEGNYREALQMSQHAEEDWISLVREWLNAIMKNGPIAQVKWVEEVSKLGRERQKQFLRYFNHLLEQSIRLRTMGEYYDLPANEHLMPPNEKDFAAKLNNRAGISEQQAIIEELDRASYYIERNANAKMLFLALTIKLYHIIADKSVILVA